MVYTENDRLRIGKKPKVKWFHYKNGCIQAMLNRNPESWEKALQSLFFVTFILYYILPLSFLNCIFLDPPINSFYTLYFYNMLVIAFMAIRVNRFRTDQAFGLRANGNSGLWANWYLLFISSFLLLFTILHIYNNIYFPNVLLPLWQSELIGFVPIKHLAFKLTRILAFEPTDICYLLAVLYFYIL